MTEGDNPRLTKHDRSKPGFSSEKFTPYAKS